jgi:glycosyltransferase involved in cell wall biosynthesis
MRIAFVVPRFYPYRGGYENSILWLARGLVEKDHQVTVFTTSAYDLEAFWLPEFRTLGAGIENVEGIAVHRFPISYQKWIRRSLRTLSFLPNWQLKARFARPSFLVPGLHESLVREKPDVIHVGPLPYNSLMYEGLKTGRQLGSRVIATPCTHFGVDNKADIAQFYTQRFQIEILKRCDAVISMTEAERQRLSFLGVPSERIVIANYGIDPADVIKGNGECFLQKYGIDGPIILHLGTKAHDKGTILVVEAMKLLWTQGSRAWLVLAGSSLSQFDDYLARNSRFDRLLNMSSIEDEEKRDLLAATTILAHPSRVESFGLVYMEAWANGKPVIGADMAVSREVITDQEDGLLVPFGDAPALASAIDRLLGDPETAHRMGNRGKQKLYSRFCWNVTAPKIYSVLTPSVQKLT